MSFQEELQKSIKEQNDKIIEILNESRPKEIQVTHVKKVPVKWDLSICDTKTVNYNFFDVDKPAITIEAPDKITRTVREISVTGDDSFKDKAKLLIYINDSKVFESQSFGSFKHSSGVFLKFADGFIIEPQKKVKIYAFTDIGTGLVIEAIVRFGE